MKSIRITIRLNPDEYHWLSSIIRRESSRGTANVSEWFRYQLYDEAKKRGLVKTDFKTSTLYSEIRTGRPKVSQS